MIRRPLTAALLAAGLALAAPARAAEIDTLLPSETESVIYVNMKQIVDSAIFKKYAKGQVEQMLQSNDEAQRLMKELGIDPLKDIEKITAGSWGKDKDDMNLVAIVRGNFDPEKLMATAEKESKNNGDKLSIVTEGDYKLVKFTADNSPKPFYLSAADKKTVVAGTDKKLVANALTAAVKGTKPTVKKELAQLLLKMDEKASMYTCGTVDGSKVQLPPNIGQMGLDAEKLAKQLEKMKSISFTLNITDDFTLDGNAVMADAAAADDLGDTISQLIGTVKGFLPLVTMQNPKFQPLAKEVGNTLKSGVKSKDVTLSLKISGDTINKVAGGGD